MSMKNEVNGKDMIVLRLDRSDVLNIIYACELAKIRSSLIGPDEWDRISDALKHQFFGDVLKRETRKKRDLTELNRLETYLKRRGFPYERIDKDLEIDAWGTITQTERHQIIVPKDGPTREWDAICQWCSYGADKGLLEIYGKIVRLSGDDVEGNLTARDVIDRIEEVYGRSENGR